MAWRWRRRIGFCFAVAMLAAGAWIGLFVAPRDRNQPPRQTSAPKPAAGAFVGSQACKKCHSKEFESFSQHPMAKSVASILDAEPIEDYTGQTTFTPNPQRKYIVEKAQQKIVHHEVGQDREAKPIYDQAEEVRYVLGSGRRGRSYLLDRDGWLFMSPISWYSEKRCWDLSPGYDPQRHPRFDRRVPERCLQCHAGRLNHTRVTSGADFERYGQPPFAEISIGCERCHGPGEAHIAWQTHGGQHIGSDPMMRLSELSPARRDDVCNQCHLVGEFQVLRSNRSHGDFRPGDHVGDIWTVFVTNSDIDQSGATVAVSQVEQMQRSRCYIASDRRLGCITCHEPHSLPKHGSESDYFDQRCSSCHQPNHCSVSNAEREQLGGATSCIACHMPRLSANDVPHTTQTDHSIRRRTRKIESAEAEKVEQTFQVYDQDRSPLSDAELARARGLFLAERAKTEHNEELARLANATLRQAGPAVADDVRVLDAMAFCEILVGRTREAADFWSRAVSRSSDEPEILDSLAAQLMDVGEITRALQLLEQALALDPWKSDRHLRRSKLLLQRGQLRFAAESAQKALELNPSDPNVYQWLSELHRATGNIELSEEFAAKRRRLLDQTPERKKDDKLR